MLQQLDFHDRFCCSTPEPDEWYTGVYYGVVKAAVAIDLNRWESMLGECEPGLPARGYVDTLQQFMDRFERVIHRSPHAYAVVCNRYFTSPCNNHDIVMECWGDYYGEYKLRGPCLGSNRHLVQVYGFQMYRRIGG